jgi:pimeloyl-ACP methyl ester carboxylesterase
MKTIRIKTGNIKISVTLTDFQNPKAELVFIHGFPFNKSIWNEQLAVLPDDIQGIAYDVRGHGKTTSGHGYFSIDLFAKDLLNIIQYLKLKRVILCGISMGGYIALRATELSPEAISGLILCDTHSLADTNETKLSRFSHIETIMNSGKEAFTEAFLKKLFSPETDQNKKQIDFIRQVILQNKEKNICAALLALASRTDTTASLENISVPVLIIRGKEDQIISDQHVEILHQHIKNSELSLVPSSGHLPNLDNTARFNELMTDFLSRNFLS